MSNTGTALRKKGYSGTAIFTKRKPLSVKYDIDTEGHDKEGRVITLEFEDFYLVTEYTPNSQEKLARLDYRMEWENAFRTYLLKLDEKKTGDPLRGPQRGPSGNRPEEPGIQPEKRRFLRRRAGQNDRAFSSGLC